MQAFLATVRENCPRSNWSRGVEWARVKGVVTADSETPESVTLKVKADSDLMTRTVTLYLDDEDWTCDCPGKDDVCAHVAAAAIALSALDVAQGSDGLLGLFPGDVSSCSVSHAGHGTGVTATIDVSLDESAQQPHVRFAAHIGCATLTTAKDIVLYYGSFADDDVCILLVYRFGSSDSSAGLYGAVHPVGKAVGSVAVVVVDGIVYGIVARVSVILVVVIHLTLLAAAMHVAYVCSSQ